jgi:hypothetical protein
VKSIEFAEFIEFGIGDRGPVVSRLAGSFVSSLVDGYMDGGYLGLEGFSSWLVSWFVS